MRDYMERWVTPPNRVTSPTWGPLPPCKQVHRDVFPGIYIPLTKNRRKTCRRRRVCCRCCWLLLGSASSSSSQTVFWGVAIHFSFIYLEPKIFCLLKKKSLNQILQLKRVIIYFVVAYICFIRITNNSFSIQMFNLTCIGNNWNCRTRSYSAHSLNSPTSLFNKNKL